MVTHIDITATGSLELDDKTKKYIMQKIGALDRLAPRHARKSLRAEVIAAEVNRDNGNKYEVEAILFVPDKRLTAKDSTSNLMAATDIVEAKLAAQLRKYKDTKVPHVGNRKLLDRFKRSFEREAQ